MQSFKSGAAVRLLVLASALFAGACVSSHEQELAPHRNERDSERGTFLRRRLDEMAPTVTPTAKRHAPAPVAPAFHSSFGHLIAAAPKRHGEASIDGRALNYWVFGDGPESVLLIGGIHGDERSSTEAAYDLLAWVETHPSAIAGTTLVIAPEVNPDGNAAVTRRNSRNVDLNRNFPARNWSEATSAHGPGAHPGSEPETRFILALLKIYRPDRVIATHAAAASVNWDGPAELMAQRMSRKCGLPAEASIGYPTPGSLGSYLGVDHGVPTITLELATKDRVGSAQHDVREALLAGIRSGSELAGSTPWFNDLPASR